MPHEGPAFLSNTATQEIEEILGDELNILFAIDIKGNIRRFYSSHFDITAINALKDNNTVDNFNVNNTIPLLIKTRIPKREIEEEIDPDPLHLHHCPCCHAARCRTCD
jgi:hypothetical protein